MDEFESYNRHYLRADEQGRVTDAWSDGPLSGKEIEGAVCFNSEGGYQLRLILDGELTEENPPIFDFDGIPLYKWDGEAIHKRTEAEIEADRKAVPPPPPSPLEQLRADVDFIAVMQGVEL